MKVLVDMNLSPNWVSIFQKNGIEALHWSSVGRYDEKDRVIMDWAQSNNYIVFTHDLDFGTILALNKSKQPSVVILRATDIGIDNSSEKIISIFRKNQELLILGALVIYDDIKERVRILPLTI